MGRVGERLPVVTVSGDCLAFVGSWGVAHGFVVGLLFGYAEQSMALSALQNAGISSDAMEKTGLPVLEE
jgi:hypothetical protein